jgi:hypothetical protein
MKRKLYISLGMVAILTSCTKNFLDINTDPNSPAKVELVKLLPTTEQGLAYGLGFTNDNRGARGLTEILAVYMHQVTVREAPDQYGAVGSDVSIVGAWTGIYASAPQQTTGGNDITGTLQNAEVIIAQATAADNLIYAGIAKIIKAYAMSEIVDAFGNAPYSQANKFASEGIRYPVYDKGATIYPQLLTLLDEGITDLTKTAANTRVPGSDDLFYGGDVDLWTRAANTIKLKLYNQIRLVQNVTAEVTALETGNKLINNAAGGLMMNYGVGSTPDDRNPGFNDYFATQRSHYQSPWFYSILKGYNPKIFANNPDPRLPYYFYNQLSDDEAAQSPNEYRDGSFLSIIFGSAGPNRDFAQDNSMTVFGIYPVGGRYDEGDALTVTSSDATGAAPFRMLTYADRLYIEAELMNAGVLPGDARAKFAAALAESFAQVDFVVEKTGTSQTVPSIVADPATATYITKVMAEYDSRATATGKLEIIMTEKWIQSFGNSNEQYTDYRRTGYPIVFNPNDNSQAPGHKYQPPINGDPFKPNAQPAVTVQLSRNYPFSLPWSQDDLNQNPNAPAQKAPAADSSRVFWDIN